MNQILFLPLGLGDWMQAELSAMHAAALMGQDEILDILFSYGANPDAVLGRQVNDSQVEFTTLIGSAIQGRKPSALRSLLKNGADH